eukprot:6391378-Amphidinium_carterae.1
MFRPQKQLGIDFFSRKGCFLALWQGIRCEDSAGGRACSGRAESHSSICALDTSLCVLDTGARH